MINVQALSDIFTAEGAEYRREIDWMLLLMSLFSR